MKDRLTEANMAKPIVTQEAGLEAGSSLYVPGLLSTSGVSHTT